MSLMYLNLLWQYKCVYETTLMLSLRLLCTK